MNSLKIIEGKISKINFKGKGGKEQEIISCFANKLIRKNSELFDCEDEDSGEKYEFKKQANTQWFDPRKFFNLTENEKKISLVFILVDKDGFCDVIFLVKLDQFVEKNFSTDQLKDAYKYGKKYPKDQIKSGVNIREFLEKNQDVVKTVWRK